jgi:hypothetical protein
MRLSLARRKATCTQPLLLLLLLLQAQFPWDNNVAVWHSYGTRPQ